MRMTIKAIYENGIFRPLEPVDLEEHTQVMVSIPAELVPIAVADPIGWKAAEALIGFIEHAPPDMAEFHDAYLGGRRR